MVVVVSFFVYLYLLVSHFFGASLSPTSFAPKSRCPQHPDGVRSVNLSCCNSSFLILSSVCKICLSMVATFIVTFFIQQGYNQYEHFMYWQFFSFFLDGANTQLDVDAAADRAGVDREARALKRTAGGEGWWPWPSQPRRGLWKSSCQIVDHGLGERVERLGGPFMGMKLIPFGLRLILISGSIQNLHFSAPPIRIGEGRIQGDCFTLCKGMEVFIHSYILHYMFYMVFYMKDWKIFVVIAFDERSRRFDGSVGSWIESIWSGSLPQFSGLLRSRTLFTMPKLQSPLLLDPPLYNADPWACLIHGHAFW